MDESKRCNDLSGKEWLQNSFSIWRDIAKTKEEKAYKHPASYPAALCEKLIRTFSRPGGAVLDPFNGIGSTTAAAAALGREAVGIDLNEDFCEIARSRAGESENVRILCGDSCELLDTLPEDYFDICVTSPPYWDILNMKRSADQRASVNYSDKQADIGNIANYGLFLQALAELFEQVCRVLRPGGYCIVNVMDIRKKSSFYPLHSDLASVMQKVGYLFDDLIIWDRQSDYNNMRPLGYPYRFRINKVHEYLLIFIKKDVKSVAVKAAEVYDFLMDLKAQGGSFFIEAEARPDRMNSFLSEYNARHHEALTTRSEGVICLQPDADKWGLELRLYVAEKPPAGLDGFGKNPVYRNEYLYRLNDNRVIRELLDRGCRLGEN